MKQVIAIRHLAFEDLGSLATVLNHRGYRITYHDAGIDDPASPDLPEPDLLVVLGGPIGVYQQEDYPRLGDEIAWVRRRLKAGRPTLGICLGAQIMATTLGAHVGSATTEIDWSRLELTPQGLAGPLRHLAGTSVLHWHGDAFELPPDAARLAMTSATPNQAFAIGSHGFGLQFHPEVQWPAFERWLIGHTRRLAARDRPIPAFRAESRIRCKALVAPARRCLEEWLDGIDAGASGL